MAFTRQMISDLRILLRPMATRIANSIARAVVQLVDDDRQMQLLQLGVLEGEDIDDAEHFQPYGYKSVPLPGAEAVVLFPNGDRAHPLVVVVDDRRDRPTGWEPGEAGLYSGAGAIVRLTADGGVVVIPGGAGTVQLGEAGASDPVARKSDIDAIESAINGAAVVANDGGAALKANILAAWPGSVGSAKVRTD